MLISVFRVEHSVCGTGIFSYEHPLCKRLMRIAGRVAYLPSPADDGMYPLWPLDRTKHFGCPSIYSLKHWVMLRPGCEKNVRLIKRLNEIGFVIREYLAEEKSIEFGQSGLQLAFDRDFCDSQGLSQTYPITDLLARPPFVFVLRGGKKRLFLPHVAGRDDMEKPLDFIL